MHDTLDYIAHEPIHRQYHHHEMTFSMMYAYTENFVLPLSHDEVVHGKGSLLRKMPGDRWQQLANAARAATPTCGRTPASSCCSWATSSARSREWSEAAVAGLVAARHPRPPRRLRPGPRPEPRSTATTRRCGRRTTTRPASTGSTPTTPAATSFSFLRFGTRRLGRWPASPTSPARRTRTTGSACPRAGRWDEVVNTDADVYSGSGVGNLGGVTRRTSPGTASRTPPR